MHLALLRRRDLTGPVGALALVLLSAAAPSCASTPKGPAGTEGASCAGHADCADGFLCDDDEESCVPDECTTGDDCGSKELGASRCGTIEGAPAVERCDFDGYRCMEWSGEACPTGATCGASPTGSACLGADGQPVVVPDETIDDAAAPASGDEG